VAANLVIIESAGKIKKFRAALSNDYDVMASVGHCVDLPERQLGIDIKKDFEPTWEVKDDKAAVVKKLQAAAKKAKQIFMMTDEDREGEAIAWHLANLLKGTKAKIVRATTNEITKKGITQAISNPGDLDQKKIDAYLVRRLLDRLCGYKTSYLTKQATGGRSAGRVQSAILAIIVERELEITNFKPEEYWVLTAYLLSSKGEPYTGVLTSKIKVKNEKQATEIYNAVIKGIPTITSVETKTVTANPFPPFTTASMTQAASSVLGWGAARMMKVAQSLYEAGHITYHRTDSPFMASESIDAIRAYISNAHGAKYLPGSPRLYKAKAGAQEAHECCRPTDINAHLHMDGDDAKLYEMIWRRAVACQMASGQDERTKVITRIADYDFHSNGNVVLFDGYRKVWTYGSGKETVLPKLTEGEVCTLKSLEKEQKFTQPPPRYSDGSLNKKCEDEQIARPATFGSFVETLKARGYIAKKGKTISATELGVRVIEFLKAADVCFVDIKFTAQMEALLDEIQSATKGRSEVLSEFWKRLREDIERGKKVKNQAQVTEFECPKCHGKLLSKHSKFGPFFACENYKPPKTVKGKKVAAEDSCDYTANVDKDGKPKEKEPPKPKEYADFPCKNCGGKMVKRSSKYGEFYGCAAYPKCKTVADLDGTFKETKKKKAKS
jgi:DNA topoisomerase-1